MPLTRRQLAQIAFGGAVASLVAACQAPAPAALPPTVAPAANPLVKPRAAGAPLTAVQASSELAQGRNRFAIGLIDANNESIITGNVTVEFFKLLRSEERR